MYSLAMSKLIPCSLWDTEVMNQVISNGTEYYIQCFNKTGSNNLRYLSVREVLGDIQVSDRLFRSQYGMIDEYDSTKNNIIQNIRQDLQDFFNSDCNTATLLAADYSYGIIKCENLIYFVDSHSKDINGYPDKNGFGGVRIYNDIDSLAKYLRDLHLRMGRFNLVQYEITYIDIEDMGDIEGNII
jgi:hypothetical protein